MNPNEPSPDGQADEILRAALEYCRRGWCVVRVEPGTKAATVKSKRWKRRPSEDTVRKWFSTDEKVSIGIMLGPLSNNLACRDFDDMGAYDTWAAAHPELSASLPTVITARGRHVYFRATVPKTIKGHDGELRGERAIVVLPPSAHESGHVYRWGELPPAGWFPTVPDVAAAGLVPGVEVDSGSSEKCYRESAGEFRKSERREQSPPGESKTKNGIARSARARKLAEVDWSDVFDETLPKRIGQRHWQVFELARLFKSWPEFADVSADDLADAEIFVQAWHAAGLRRGVIGTEADDESVIDFVVAWDKIRFPKGEQPMAAIMEAAQRNPLPECAMRYRQPLFRLLVGICRELQRQAGAGPFFLACRTAAELLDVDQMTASRWLKLLQIHNVLKLVERGTAGSKKASRYKYVGD